MERCFFGAVLACGFAASGAHARAGSDALRGAEPDRIVRLLAEESVGALRASAWHDGDLVSPVIGVDLGLSEAQALAALIEDVPPRGASVWAALAAGRGAPVVDGAVADLERACGLLVREVLVREWARSAQDQNGTTVPADLIAEVARAVPLPPTNPAADPALIRRIARLERRTRLASDERAEMERVASEFAAIVSRGREWRDRWEAVMRTIAERSDGPEGRAVVEALMRARLAATGWLPPEAARATDRVRAAVQRAMAERPPCRVLAETVLAIEPSCIERIEAIAVTPDGRLVVGRSRSELTQASIDRWRVACGLRCTPHGWEGLPARPRARPPRIRNAPFGVSPPPRAGGGGSEGHALSYAWGHVGRGPRFHALREADAVAGLWPRGAAPPVAGTRPRRGLRGTGDCGERTPRACRRRDCHHRRP